MNLSDPRGLFLLALAAPIVVLYLLKTRRTEVHVGSTWLWQRAERDLLARHPFRRLRWVLPLVLQLCLLLLLALAAARPSQHGRDGAGAVVCHRTAGAKRGGAAAVL
jgi:hypothetical protein